MPPVTRLGLLLPNGPAPSVPDDELFEHVVTVAVTAEASGFDALWVVDAPGAVWRGPGAPRPAAAGSPGRRVGRTMFEAYTLLGALAARTGRARLGAIGAGLFARGPAMLVKQVTALDVLSGGRAMLGVGAPMWVSTSPGHPGAEGRAERHGRLEEGLQVCRALMAGGQSHFVGSYYRLDGAVNRPPPVQTGVPVVVTAAGEPDVLPLVARYGDVCVLTGDDAGTRRTLAELARHCEALGRDPSTVTTVRTIDIVVAEQAADVAARIDEQRRDRGRGAASWAARAVTGRPAEVADQVEALLASGLDGLVVRLPGSDPETVALAGATVRAAVGHDPGQPAPGSGPAPES